MGKLYKSGQYAKAFSENAEAKETEKGSRTNRAKMPWREAAMAEIVRLIGARGGLDKQDLKVKDSRSTFKMIRQLDVVPGIDSQADKKEHLFALYQIIKEKKSISEIREFIERRQAVVEGETKNLFTAIYTFLDPKENYVENNQAYSPKEGDSRLALAVPPQNPNPFQLELPQTHAAASAHSMPMVPQYKDAQFQRVMPWMVADNPHYSAERAERHEKTQYTQAVIYTLGASIINNNPDLLAQYHAIAPDTGSPPTRQQLNTQAFYTLAVGMHALPKEAVEAGFAQYGQISRFMTQGTQGLVFPNGVDSMTPMQ